MTEFQETSLSKHTVPSTPRIESAEHLKSGVAESISSLIELVAAWLDPDAGGRAPHVRADGQGLANAEWTCAAQRGRQPAIRGDRCAGLAQFLADPAQSAMLDGSTAAELAVHTAKRAQMSDDPGAIALAAWASAEVSGVFAGDLFDRLEEILRSGAAIPVVDISWLITAAVAARELGDTAELAARAATTLAAAQGDSGIFPHLLPAEAAGRFRAHVGCFRRPGLPDPGARPGRTRIRRAVALAAAERLRGADLRAAGRSRAVVVALRRPQRRRRRGLSRSTACTSTRWRRWRSSTCSRPAATTTATRSRAASAVAATPTRRSSRSWSSDGSGLVWRKVGRREPRKAARATQRRDRRSAARSSRLPGLDRLLPAGTVDHECRPYELGLAAVRLAVRCRVAPHVDDRGEHAVRAAPSTSRTPVAVRPAASTR